MAISSFVGHSFGVNDTIFPVSAAAKSGLESLAKALAYQLAPTGTTAAYRNAKREPPSVAADWISDDINAGKWEGYTPPPLPQQ